MTSRKTPVRVKDSARPESDLSQVLAHGPALSAAYGRIGGGFLMLAAILKASKGPLGVATAFTVVITVIYKLWF